MQLAISNIAWTAADDESVAATLNDFGVHAIELAPTTVWPQPLQVTEREATAYRTQWERRGISIVALQALLFGRPDLLVFGTPTERAETLAYLHGICQLAGWLGAVPLVFGSPRNRRAAGLADDERARVATEFFAAAGAAAAAHGVCLCLEPNPREYDCDFVNTAAEARLLIDRVASPGFGLHLDAAAMTLAGEAPGEISRGTRPRHFHISEPYLGAVGAGNVDHPAFARALGAAGYDGWCSIEMRAQASGTVEAVARALELACSVYGSGRLHPQ